jgi:predicted  nucleic acid-binding Zn-ribbon protein
MLVKCAECGGVVSNKAAACPHCGYERARAPKKRRRTNRERPRQAQREPEAEPTPARRGVSGWRVFAYICVGLALLGVILVLVVAGAFALLGQGAAGASATADEAPLLRWRQGDVADVTITMVTTDVKDLACASDELVAGRHCGFAANRNPHPEGNDVRVDPNVLQPHTTTDRVQLLASGMWVSPELKIKLETENWNNPSPRFQVDCKYRVEGHMKEAAIRWKPEPDGGWLAGPAKDWYVGSLSDCRIRATRSLPPSQGQP